MEELWLCQQENNYDAIFLQETDYIEGKPLGHLNIGKTECLLTVRRKSKFWSWNSCFSTATKNVFRDDLPGADLELVWNEIQIQGTETLVANIYTLPGNENHLHKLDMELEKNKGKAILLVGDFNCRNTPCSKHIKRNTKMGKLLEDIINHHNLFIVTDAEFTYQQSASINKSGKSTIDLTLIRGLANVRIAIKGFDLINTRHKAVEIYIPEASQNKQTPKFRTKNAVWKDWENTLEPNLLEYFNSFPNEICHEIFDQQVEILTMLIQTSATDFFGLTEASNKKSKGWWNSEIKAARKTVKESVKQHRIRQSPANLEKMEKAKKEHKTLITESKLKQQNSDLNFLNNSRD